MHRIRNKYVLLTVLCIAFGSCAQMVRLTPKQTVLWAMNVYVAQYDLYLAQVLKSDISPELKEQLKADPKLITDDMIKKDFTDEQRRMLRLKKKILVELYPLINMSHEYITAGQLPPAEAQDKLVKLINQLVTIMEE